MAYPKHTILVTSKTALDSVAGASARIDAGDDKPKIFFTLFRINEIEALVPWAHGLVAFTARTYNEEIKKPGAIPERALAATRQRLVKKLRQLTLETKSIRFDDISFCLGSLAGSTLHLTHRGDIAAYLLHTLTGSDGIERFRWIPITATGEDKKITNTDATIVSGSGSPGDTLLIATESVIDSLGLEQLEHMIGAEPIDGVRAVFEQSCMGLPGKLSFGALIMRVGEDALTNTSVTASMASLEKRRKTTATLLAPEGYPAISTLRSFFGKQQAIGERIGQLIRSVIGSIIHVFVLALTIPQIITARRAQPAVGREQKNVRLRTAKILAEKITALPRSSQRLLIVSLLFAYLFSQTLVYLTDRQAREQIASQTNVAAAEIQEKLDRAEAGMIFGNDTDAAALAKEAQELVVLYPQRTARQKEQRASLAAQVAALFSRIERVTILTNPTVTAEINTPELNQISGIIATKGDLYIFQSRDNAFAKVSNGTIERLPVSSVNIGSVTRAKLDEAGTIILLTRGQGLASFTPETNTVNAYVFTSPLTNMTDVSFYNNRLYVSAPADKQIYRLTRAANGFSSPAPWSSGNIPELANANGIVVDGNVYVLLENGNIIKLFSGAIDSSWRGVAPANGSGRFAPRLVGSASSPYLFAYDTGMNRVVMWEKTTGKLLHQYALATNDKIIDYTVSQNNDTLYLLTATAILQTPLLR